jgi:hypothetical protein
MSVLGSARPLGLYGQNVTPAADLEVDRLEHRWNTSLERCGLLRTSTDSAGRLDSRICRDIARSARETRLTRNEGVPGSSPGVGSPDLQVFRLSEWEVPACAGRRFSVRRVIRRSRRSAGRQGRVRKWRRRWRDRGEGVRRVTSPVRNAFCGLLRVPFFLGRHGWHACEAACALARWSPALPHIRTRDARLGCAPASRADRLGR